MKTSEAFPSRYLKAADLGDRQWELIIDEYQMEDLQGQDGPKQTKPVLYFRRGKKGLVLNMTNARTISAVYGDEMDDWIGKPLILFTRIVEARGEEVNAIRVRVPQPGQSTAPSHHQPRPAPSPGFTSGLPGKEAQPAPRKPAAEHDGQTPVYTEANPPPNTGQGYRDDMDDQIPF
jgi:hypothetical protein